MIHRQATFRIQPVWLNGTTPRHVIPTEMKWSGGIFPSCKFYLTSVITATWEDSSTPLRYGRNDMRFALVGTNSNEQRIWRQIAAATAASYNGTPNVAAMIHRHPAPAEGLAPFRI